MDAPCIRPLDTGYLGIPDAALAFLVLAPEAPVLVESGCAVSHDALRAALAAHGVAPRDLAAVVVTHVHLDHAGGAGHLAREGVPVLVHPRGARHLADPARLVAGSRAVHGARYEAHYGDPLPVDTALVRSVDDGASVDLGGWRFTAIATPGHARHHHAWLAGPRDGEPTDLFTGDALGMTTPGSSFLSIPAPPSDIDLPAWRATIARLESLAAGLRCHLTHGGVRPLGAHREAFARRFREETALLVDLARTGAGDDEADLAYRAFLEPRIDATGVPERLRAAMLGRAFRAMNLAGVRQAVAAGRA
ncbi:MAG: hypothetical protein RIS86_2277 [Planctomycetota bacterium]